MKKMKTRILLGALAFPLVFAACTNDEFEVNNAGQQQGLEGDMVELPENFSLLGAKAGNADTRGGMIDNQMGWYPTLKVDAGEDGKLTATDLNLEANWDQIGLAWLNVTPGSQVYSNYKFANYGWLYTNEDGVHFERIRRITGYLVGTVDRFNNGKRAEERDRVKHTLNFKNAKN